MRKILPLILASILLSACTHIEHRTTSTPAPLILSPVPTPTLEATQSERSVSDITYCTFGDVELKMDIYFPQGGDARWPVAMYIHGGGWIGGDKSQISEVDKQALLQAGFLIASVNYRLAPEYKFPAPH